jgi:hypothetical protein
VAAIALGGGVLAGCGSSTTTAATPSTTGSTAAATSNAPGTRPPGFGKVVTGTAASKAKAAALATYPGTVERVMQLDDGSYMVHVLRSSGSEVHVKVSKAFKVTGTVQGMPGRGAPPGTPAPSTGTTT